MSLITTNDIYSLTGMDDISLSHYIPYAEAQAKNLIGYLEEETKEVEIFVDNDTNEFFIGTPISSISSIKYQESATSDEEVVEDYRYIKSKGLILLDDYIPANSVVTVTYKIGWTSSNVPELVKLLIVILVLSHYYSLNPNAEQTSGVIVQEKIGDYMVKYSGYTQKLIKPLDEWIVELVELIKGGSIYPSVEA